MKKAKEWSSLGSCQARCNWMLLLLLMTMMKMM